MNKHLLLLAFLSFTCHAEEITKKSYTQEQLITVRQNALNHAMEVLKDKKPSPDEILKVAKEFEAYMLADDLKKVIEQAKSEVSPNDFEKVQQPKVNISNEDKTSFSGLSVGINGQLKSTSAKARYDGYTLDGIGQQNFIANIQADYEFKLNNQFGLMFGATVDLNDSELLKLNGKFRNLPSKDFSVTEKNHFSLFVAPTYQLNDSTLGFLKLAYHRSKVEMENNINWSNQFTSWSRSSSKTLNGYGVGLGVRSHLYNNIYANLELQRVMYSTDSIVTADLGTGTTIGSFGLSYSFNDEKKPSLLSNNSSGKFNGLSIGLSGLLKSSSIKTTSTFGGESGTFDSVGQQNLGTGIFADYAFRVSDRALFLVGGTYDLNDSESFKISGNGSEAKVKEKKHYSVYLAPAYQMSQTSLGYVKFAYHQAEFENINSLTRTQLGYANTRYSKDFNGYGIGLGFRTLITDNFYGNLEVQRVFYGKEDIYPATFDVSSTIGTLGLSYKF
ncbi:porin family protein [Candidatus Methylopumilus universalis]|uniref:Porin family protein n=1 Tax=Candidatus Methylopumilus universalis TaxID=2588536 RepID=A0ABX5VUB6_9PROT|nr:outer membrane beta-barrel protein [Candidatus Methylopumilus universalis]QDC51291.1 porin family protein [Candidatus Methylopumilus universalis]QDC61429.1 porin family protein [Candidatus Methylopumilus universalis]